MKDVLWGVRWSEKGHAPRLTEALSERDARDFYQYLLQRYAEHDRTDKPELLRAEINWVVQDA